MKLVVDKIIELALLEDLPHGDLTAELLVDKKIKAKGEFIAKESGVLCGVDLIPAIFEKLGTIVFKTKLSDGAPLRKGDLIATVEGSARTLLAGERVALNFIQHLSGIASRVARLKNTKVLDTRKTTPGLRYLEKYAVKVGGGRVHRLSLSSAIMVKNNHIDIVGMKVLLSKLKPDPFVPVIFECRDLSEVESALSVSPRGILLDNMKISEIRKASRIIRERNPNIFIEISGQINDTKLKELSKLDVDGISISSLTRGVKPLDISLRIK